MKRALVPASLILLSACRQPGPQIQRPCAAAQEGLTLVHINPSLPSDQQAAKRLQIRVDRVASGADGALIVTQSFTEGLAQPTTATIVIRQGGASRVSADGKTETALLPPGFPDAAASWTSPAGTSRVIGRGAWVQGAKVLPPDLLSEGVWVECRPEQGPVARSLYLPGLGEVQTDERQSDGRWVTVDLLTQYGFTDLPPALVQAPAPETKPAAKRAKRTR